MGNLAYRNIKVFLRDRASVLYSLLGVFIIIGLYVLFLGDLVSSEVKGMPKGRFLMDSWIMAGVLAAGSFTTTLGALGIRVEDETNKRSKDFFASPLRRSTIAGGYLLSAIGIGAMLCAVTLVLAEVYIVANGGAILPLVNLLQTLGVALLSVLASGAMLFLLVSFVHSNNAFAGISTIAGTLIGFLTGIYIPIGTLPAAIQTVVKVFPISHAAALLRQIMMEAPMAAAFAGAPQETVDGFRAELGMVFSFGGSTPGPWLHLLVLGGTAVVFFALSVLRISKMNQES